MTKETKETEQKPKMRKKKKGAIIAICCGAVAAVLIICACLGVFNTAPAQPVEPAAEIATAEDTTETTIEVKEVSTDEADVKKITVTKDDISSAFLLIDRSSVPMTAVVRAKDEGITVEEAQAEIDAKISEKKAQKAEAVAEYVAEATSGDTSGGSSSGQTTGGGTSGDSISCPYCGTKFATKYESNYGMSKEKALEAHKKTCSQNPANTKVKGSWKNETYVVDIPEVSHGEVVCNGCGQHFMSNDEWSYHNASVYDQTGDFCGGKGSYHTISVVESEEQGHYEYTCSNCGKVSTEQYAKCPNCGAEMY